MKTLRIGSLFSVLHESLSCVPRNHWARQINHRAYGKIWGMAMHLKPSSVTLLETKTKAAK